MSAASPAPGFDAPARIMMVTPRFPPYRGGVETHTYEVSRRVAAEPGFEVTVLTTDLAGSLPPSENLEGVQVERVGAYPPWADLYWSPAVHRRVRAERPDLVHVQGYHTLVPPLALLAARRARIPYLVTLHSGGHSSRLRNAIRPIQVRLLRPLLRGAARVIAVSAFEATHFAEAHGLGRDNLTVIPNGADIGGPHATGHRDPDLIMSVGRLERYKGHHRVVEALSYVQRSLPNARLRIVGGGPYEASLRALVARHGLDASVDIVSVPSGEMGRLLGSASVVTLLSEYESQGLAVHEALARGCRVVVDSGSALAEVAGLEQATAVSSGDPPQVIAAALVDQLTRGRVGAAATPDLLTWDDCAAATSALYASVLRARSG